MAMQKIKISPSLLDQWEKLMSGELEQYSKGEETIREYILGEYKKNAATSKGDAVHAMIQHGISPYQTGEIFTCAEPELPRTWKFTRQAAEVIEQVHKNVIGGVFETWANIEFDFRGVRIRMNMRTDMLSGLEIHEFKTSKYAKRYADYENSRQKMAYFAAYPEAQTITYHSLQVPDENRQGLISWAKYDQFIYPRTGNEMDQIKETMYTLLDFIMDDMDLREKLTIQ